jgi:hypothetical protein
LVDPPSPPRSYTLPDERLPTVTAVSNASELERALRSGSHRDIILEDGRYRRADLSRDWLQIRGHRLWARHVGAAVLEFGVNAGGRNGRIDHGGAQLHGLAFDIADEKHAPRARAKDGSAAVLTWGDATDVVVEDCTFAGHGVVDCAICARQVAGLSVSRVEIRDFARYGIYAANPDAPPLRNPVVIEDAVIQGIGDPQCWGVEDATCDYWPGEQENGIHLGEQADVDRVFIRDVRANGIVTGGKTAGTRLANLDIDRIGVGHDIMGVGVLFENTTRDTLVDWFCIGPSTRVGVNSEWDHGKAPRGRGNRIRHGLVRAAHFGVYFDQGTVDGTVEQVTFRGYSRAAIGMYNNLTSADRWPAYDNGGTQKDNRFDEAEVSGRTCRVTRSHWKDATPECE